MLFLLDMKNLLIIASFLLFLLACKNNQSGIQNTNAIQFDIYYTEQYCGGAAPPDELMEELHTPKPYSDTIYIHEIKDARREAASLKIRLKKGKGDLPYLANGVYVAYKAPVYQIDSSSSDFGRENCYYESSFMPFFTFTISEPNQFITDTVNIQCDPCVPPMP
jgi:hypothetical protein